MSRERKDKDLDKKLSELIKENKSLKKELGKLRKDAIHTQDALVINQEYARQLEIVEKKEKIKKCEFCSGDIKRFEINKIIFDICQRCKSRKRVTEEQAEFIGAVAKFEAESGTNEEKEHIIEEFFDMIQASLGLLDKMGLINLLEEGRIKHMAKLIERGWEFKKMI
jgi:hypothetical protein